MEAKLKKYVDESLKHGHAKEKILESLRRAGYPSESLEEVSRYLARKKGSRLHIILPIAIIVVLAAALILYASRDIGDVDGSSDVTMPGPANVSRQDGSPEKEVESPEVGDSGSGTSNTGPGSAVIRTANVSILIGDVDEFLSSCNETALDELNPLTCYYTDFLKLAEKVESCRIQYPGACDTALDRQRSDRVRAVMDHEKSKFLSAEEYPPIYGRFENPGRYSTAYYESTVTYALAVFGMLSKAEKEEIAAKFFEASRTGERKDINCNLLRMQANFLDKVLGMGDLGMSSAAYPAYTSDLSEACASLSGFSSMCTNQHNEAAPACYYNSYLRIVDFCRGLGEADLVELETFVEESYKANISAANNRCLARVEQNLHGNHTYERVI